jgi:diguanylate cyclase (GGDEF)-like protein/PAS domain S-box-containing protein
MVTADAAKIQDSLAPQTLDGETSSISTSTASNLLETKEVPAPEAVQAAASQETAVEKALREREANLLALIENTQDAVWSVDRQYQLVTLNSTFKRQFKTVYGVELALGMNIISCLPDAAKSIWMDYYDRVLRGDRFAIELRFDLPDGPADIEISFNPIITNAEEITGVAVFGRNITDRKRAEADLQQAKDQLQAVLDAVPGCVSWFSSDCKYLGINRYLAATFNVCPEDFVGRELGFMESSPGFADFVRKFIASSVKESSVEIASRVGDSIRNYIVVAQKYFQDQAAVFVGLDITDRMQVEEALRESQERYALAVRGANDGLWDWNLRTSEIYFSPRWREMLGYEEGKIGNTLDEWFSRIHPEDLYRVKAQLSAHLDGSTVHFESEYRMQHRDGSYRWLLNRGLAVRDENGKACRMAGSQTDITKRRQAEEQLLHDALHDSLTGLPNRALFVDRLSQAIERTRRPQGYRFAVLFLDVDRFKVINDSLGHVIGDQLLVAIAQRLQKCLRIGDTIARLGGDEFTILMEDIKHPNDSTQLAERIHQEFLLPFNLNGQEVFTTVSIGIALSESGGDRPEDLLRNADTAMYRAKVLGRARHEMFDAAMHARAVALLQLETDLRRAVSTLQVGAASQEFQLRYQPIVCLETCKIVGFEALVRWQHPERGWISPGDFIPVAEDTGLVIPLGQWILAEACRQLREWQLQFPQSNPLSVSVNLSTKQFAQPQLIEQISQLLQQYQVEPHRLKIEITESAIMENTESATALLEQLKALGLQLMIDDFGTGYSSLSYLHQFPIDTVKIDQSFVGRMGTDEAEDEGSEIVRAIVTLAHTLAMNVVAEGIETAEQVSQLKTLKAECGQGYFFAKPLSSEEAAVLIKTDPHCLNGGDYPKGGTASHRLSLSGSWTNFSRDTTADI